MVILGLGSNVSDRLDFLRRGYAEIKRLPGCDVIRVSPVYVSDALLPENAPAGWDKPYLNLAVICRTSLSPMELLSHLKNIEKKLGRKDGLVWGPRPLDIDILAWDDLVIYDDHLHVPHEHLHERPFALFPFADVAPRWVFPGNHVYAGKTAMEVASKWPSRFDGSAPFRTRQISQRVEGSQIVGILNLTDDSFSNDGLLGSDNLLVRAHEMVAEGADVIDVGAEASNPHAKPLSSAEEWRRLQLVLPALLAEKNAMVITPKISIDTRHADVAEKALELGVDWINDVSGLDNPKMVEVLAATSAKIVFMHQLGLPVSQGEWLPEHIDPVNEVLAWIETKLQMIARYNISKERLILDIGIGFGKNAEQSLELLQNLDKFKQFDLPLLIGHSRKSFLKQFTDKDVLARDIETLAISSQLINQNIDYLRVHNVDWTARTLKVLTQVRPLLCSVLQYDIPVF